MRFFRTAAAGLFAFAIATSSARAAEIVVYSTISCKEALIDLVPEFEHASGHKVNITYGAGPDLLKQIREGLKGDVFVGPEEFSGPLLAEGKLAAGSRAAFARSSTALAVRSGAPKPDISSPDKLKAALLGAKGISYSAGASGINFVKAAERLGIKDAIVAKRVAAKPGELMGAVVARGEADIAVQQISELLPVKGIEIIGRMPGDLDQPIVYGTNVFSTSTQKEGGQAFIRFMRSPPAQKVLREKGLDPV